MERERWYRLYRCAVELSRRWPDGHVFSAAFIVGVYLWAAVHDRPVVWACDPTNWPTEMKIGKLPSQATMSRRLRSQAVCDLLVLIEDALRRSTTDSAAAPEPLVIDGKPLVVGGYSKDSEAKYGRAAGGFSNGYKVVAVNPHRTHVDGDECHPNLAALPERPDIIDVVVPARIGLDVAREAKSLGYENVWLQPGAESPALVAYLEDQRVPFIADSCIMVAARQVLRSRQA